MSERILVCKALDERDLLVKRIIKDINRLRVIGVCRKKDEKIDNMSIEDFKKQAESSYQSVRDLISRYNKIDTAIVQANATTEIELSSGTKMTRAEAIALRKSIKGQSCDNFMGLLIDTLKEQYNDSVTSCRTLDSKADRELESYKTGLVNRDSTKKDLSDKEVELAEKMVEGLYGVIVDPLNLSAEIDKLSYDYDVIVSELDTVIKISNATTYIELD